MLAAILIIIFNIAVVFSLILMLTKNKRAFKRFPHWKFKYLWMERYTNGHGQEVPWVFAREKLKGQFNIAERLGRVASGNEKALYVGKNSKIYFDPIIDIPEDDWTFLVKKKNKWKMTKGWMVLDEIGKNGMDIESSFDNLMSGEYLYINKKQYVALSIKDQIDDITGLLE